MMYKTSILQKYALKRLKKIHPLITVAGQGFDLKGAKLCQRGGRPGRWRGWGCGRNHINIHSLKTVDGFSINC